MQVVEEEEALRLFDNRDLNVTVDWLFVGEQVLRLLFLICSPTGVCMVAFVLGTTSSLINVFSLTSVT
jgi:hypothetical protein